MLGALKFQQAEENPQNGAAERSPSYAVDVARVASRRGRAAGAVFDDQDERTN